MTSGDCPGGLRGAPDTFRLFVNSNIVQDMTTGFPVADPPCSANRFYPAALAAISTPPSPANENTPWTSL